jgi:hypothetical protein
MVNEVGSGERRRCYDLTRTFMDERRKWLIDTVDCAIERYREARSFVTEREIIECLRSRGLRSQSTAGGSIDAAAKHCLLIDKSDAVKFDSAFKELGGHGSWAPTVRGLLAVAIVRASKNDKQLMRLLAGMAGIAARLYETALLGGVLDVYNELVQPRFTIDGRLVEGERGFRLTLVLRGEEPNERERRIMCEGAVDAVYECLRRNTPIVEEYVNKIDDKIKNILSRHIAIRRSFEGDAIPVRPGELDDYVRDIDSIVKVAEYLMAMYNVIYTELETAFRSLVKEVVRRELGEGGQA